MKKHSSEIFFPKDLKNDFSKLSDDLSPIHISQNFAKTTFLGTTIAHGMGIFLELLKKQLKILPSEIKELQINFHKPIKDLRIRYLCEIDQDGDIYELTIKRRSILYLRLKILKTTIKMSSNTTFFYKLSQFSAHFSNNNPALILNIDIVFKPFTIDSNETFKVISSSEPTDNVFDNHIDSNETDKFFLRLYKIESNTIVNNLPKDLPKLNLEKISSDNIMITGASRGLGFTINQILKDNLIKPFYTTRSKEYSSNLEHCFKVDFMKHQEVRIFKGNLIGKDLKIIILNAFLPIDSFSENELTLIEELKIIKRYKEITLNSYKVLSEVFPNAKFFHISTTLDETREPQLKTYIRAKRELENELPEVKHIRLPRFLSDQTNHFMNNLKIDSTIEAAQTVIKTLIS